MAVLWSMAIQAPMKRRAPYLSIQKTFSPFFHEKQKHYTHMHATHTPLQDSVSVLTPTAWAQDIKVRGQSEGVGFLLPSVGHLSASYLAHTHLSLKAFLLLSVCGK